MAGYLNSNGGGTIGALLRAIQQDRQSSPLAVPPSSDTNSPIRALTQGPLQQVEAPDSSRVIATRPETAPLSGGEQPQSVVPPAGLPSGIPGAAPVVPAVDYVPPTPSPVPTPTPSSQPASVPHSNPSPSAPANQTIASASPSIGTRIATSTPPAVLGTSTVKKAPVQAPKPSPTPAPKPPTPNPIITQVPHRSSVGSPIVDSFLKLLATIITPSKRPNSKQA